MSGVIILGSSASHGNTRKVVDRLMEKTGFDLIDLRDYSIGYFDYLHENRGDDFIPLMRQLTEKYETFVFASPIYWYSMSAIMKTFFDRISDLLKIEKDLGRTLRGKNMAALSCSGHDDQGAYYWKPFELSADYLGMHYKGHIHTVVENAIISSDSIDRIDDFTRTLLD